MDLIGVELEDEVFRRTRTVNHVGVAGNRVRLALEITTAVPRNTPAELLLRYSRQVRHSTR